MTGSLRACGRPRAAPSCSSRSTSTSAHGRSARTCRRARARRRATTATIRRARPTSTPTPIERVAQEVLVLDVAAALVELLAEVARQGQLLDLGNLEPAIAVVVEDEGLVPVDGAVAVAVEGVEQLAVVDRAVAVRVDDLEVVARVERPSPLRSAA